MIVRALDTNGDWTFGTSLSNYLSNQAAIAQDLQTNVLSFLGNCFFDLSAGIDWFTFLGGSKSQLEIQLAIAAVILNTSGVTGVSQVSANLNRMTRAFSVSYQVTTVYSTLTNTFSFDLMGGGI